MVLIYSLSWFSDSVILYGGVLWICDLGMKFFGGNYFENFFYIDFEAFMADPHAQYALENLQVNPSYHKNFILIFFIIIPNL